MTATDMTTELLTTDEAAELLRISRRTVRRLLASGELPGVRVGAQWRLDSVALDARLGRMRHTPPRHMTSNRKKAACR